MMRFCDNTKDEVIAKLADNGWQGNHARYSARFAAIIAQGEAIPQEQLVEYYLANLPRELLLEVSKSGSIEFVTWQKAAMAVSRIEIPPGKNQKAQQKLVDDKRRAKKGDTWGKMDAGRTTAAWYHRSAYLRCESDLEMRGDRLCHQRKGKEPLAKEHPLRNGASKRVGEKYNRCGDKEHYAQDCTTRGQIPRRVNEGVSSRSDRRGEEARGRLNGTA